MDKLERRQSRRHGVPARDIAVIEGRSREEIRGWFNDESELGISVTIEGDRPDLEPDQTIRIRSRRRSGRARVRYFTEESATAFR